MKPTLSFNFDTVNIEVITTHIEALAASNAELKLSEILDSIKSLLPDSSNEIQVLKSNIIRTIKQAVEQLNMTMIEDYSDSFWELITSSTITTHPTTATISRKKKINYLLGPGTRSCTINDPNGRRLIQHEDVSQLLMNYRQTSIDIADNENNKMPLNDAQILSLFFIFIFDEGFEGRYKLPRAIVPTIKASLSHELVFISDHLVLWCQNTKRLLKNGLFDDVDTALANYKIMTISNKSASDKKLVFFLESFRHKFESWQANPSTENTYILQNLSSALDIVVSSDMRLEYKITHGRLSSSRTDHNMPSLTIAASSPSSSSPSSSKAASSPSKKRKSTTAASTLSSSKKQNSKSKSNVPLSAPPSTPIEKVMPDYLSSYKVDNQRVFDLFTVEVKKDDVIVTQTYSDKTKLGIELKDMMDALVAARIPNPVVCGIVVDGYDCTTYKMIQNYEAEYDLIPINFFHPLRGVEDLNLLPDVLEAFLQVKDIIDSTIIKVDATLFPSSSATPSLPSTPIPLSHGRPSFHIPK